MPIPDSIRQSLAIDSSESAALPASCLVLFLGPSCVGKSTIIKTLEELDGRFRYVIPFTTRPLRLGEKDKQHASHNEINAMEESGLLCARNIIYGNEYATPLRPIKQALADGNFPCLDWPVDRVADLSTRFNGQVFRVYIIPPSLDILRSRMRADRDPTGDRWRNACLELKTLLGGGYADSYDLVAINESGTRRQVAEAIIGAIISRYNR